MKAKSLLSFWFITIVGVLFIPVANGQFAPAAGIDGSTAIYRDSSAFVAWATGCTINRGYMDIALPDSGLASVGDANSAIGPAGQAGVVSLGDAGVATLTFNNPIYNGPGSDFAVFENGFYTNNPLAFLEFAFVEVSSDGVNFVRFTATSNIQDSTQIPMTGVDCALVNNLAGKYTAGYGTPFDLEELKNEPGLDVNHITHVRVVDVVGSIAEQYASRDHLGHKINDPYPTLFASGGFDLDAVGVIHALGVTDVASLSNSKTLVSVYPNPSKAGRVILKVSGSEPTADFKVYDAQGKSMAGGLIQQGQKEIDTHGFDIGMYFIAVNGIVSKLVIE